MNNQVMVQILFLIGFIALIYFFMIKPQKKKEKEIKEMRNSVSVGDEILTIGGICGKVVKTKEETLVIQVGADKVKFEVMRWAVSSIAVKSKKSGTAEKESSEPEKKSGPRRLKKIKKEEPSKSENKTNEINESNESNEK